MNEKIERCITSRANPKIKELIHLRERRRRDQTQLFLIEGYRETLRALEGEQVFKELYFCPELFLGAQEMPLITKMASKGAELFRCSSSVFEKISYRDRPDGLLGVGVQCHRTLRDLQTLLLQKSTPAFLVIAEAIEKPGNLGTILRCADAAGADALILCDACTDLFNPNVVRASVGTLFTVPVIESSAEEALFWLKKQDIPLLAATPAATTLYTQVDCTRPCAIAVGTEQIGLTSRWMEDAAFQVRIPMQGKADSLNVAMATTLLLFEVVRQRTRL